MNKKRNALIVAVPVVLLIILLMGFDTVDASHIGVKNKFGVIQGTMQPGMAWTGLFTHVEQYDLRIKKMSVEMIGDQGAVDKEGQSVYANVEIIYKVNPTAENIVELYSKVGPQKIAPEALNIDGIVREGFKSITSEYTSLEIFQKRQEVKEKAINKIQENFPSEYYILDNVIISNIDFNPAFKAAIEAKKVAEETAKAKEKEVDIAKFEADKKIEAARGEAESKLALARAEAKALELKAQELTPMMVQNNWIDAWNGALPVYMFGGESPDMLMQMPLTNEE